MNRRQRKKELKKIGVNLFEASKDPVDAVQRASAIIAAVYKSDDSPVTKMAVKTEIMRMSLLQ